MDLGMVFFIFIYRDGVSESQFNQVLNIELDQIIEVHKLFNYAIYTVYISVIRTDIYFELIRHANSLMKNGTRNLQSLLLRRTTTQDSSSPMLLRMSHLASVLRIF
jgi:hypothetical protein